MNSHVISGSGSLILSVIYFIFAFQIPSSRIGFVAPNVFPFIIGILWIVISIITIIKGIMEYRSTKLEKSKEISERQIIEDVGDLEVIEQDSKKVLIILLILAGYILLFFPLGYLLSTILFIFGLTTFLEKLKWKRNLVYATVFPIIVFLIFNNLLSVQLPMGIFF